MLSVLLQVTLLLRSLVPVDMLAKETPSSCEHNWWGSKCQFACHCEGALECASDGHCLERRPCGFWFFGYECQLFDVVSTQYRTAEPYVHDHNPRTCNPHRDAKSVYVNFWAKFPFRWLRIDVKQNIYKNDFVIRLNGMEACSNQRVFDLSELSMIIMCDTLRLLTEIEVVGPIAPYICDIYAYGGRNVALDQVANQSSIIENDEDIGMVPKYAIDNNSSADFEKGDRCARTNVESSAWWSLTYKKPQLLLRTKIVNSKLNRNRLREFKFETFDDKGQLLTTFTGPNTDNEITYVMQNSRKLVSRIKITQSANIAAAEKSLNLCEVETWGLNPCPEGTWGLICEHQCECKDTDICLLELGLCAPGCDTGYYGFNCLDLCPEHCLGGKCRYRTGVCMGCEDGYTGERCAQACQPGNYGENCRFTCAKRCIDMCDFRTGVCTCDTNTKGILCTECPRGFYGQNCAKKCSMYCQDVTCNIDTAECLKCIGNRIGRFCEACPEKWYGSMCYAQCSEFCVNGTCHAIYGNCSECTNGYTGAQCKFNPNEGLNINFIIVPILLSLVLLFVVFLNLPKKGLALSEEI